MGALVRANASGGFKTSKTTRTRTTKTRRRPPHAPHARSSPTRTGVLRRTRTRRRGQPRSASPPRVARAGARPPPPPTARERTGRDLCSRPLFPPRAPQSSPTLPEPRTCWTFASSCCIAERWPSVNPCAVERGATTARTMTTARLPGAFLARPGPAAHLAEDVVLAANDRRRRGGTRERRCVGAGARRARRRTARARLLASFIRPPRASDPGAPRVLPPGP